MRFFLMSRLLNEKKIDQLAGKSAHFQITLALELDFIHSCTHDSHCKMLEHCQRHKSVTTVKDALTSLSTVRSRYT